jgi:serine/threonine-protein kinase
MTPERWRRITGLFHEALARDPRERAAFVAEACGGDAALRSEVESMIAGHAEAGAFGDRRVRASTSVVQRLAAGAAVGPYRVVELLGAGGMGEVYRARDDRLTRDVAVKVLPAAYAADAQRLARFEQEARAVGSLNHPNVVTVHDVGIADGQPYLVTELVDGDTLRGRIRRGPLPAARACAIAADIARGLAAAHAAGIVHRDLKPENVMITRDGRVKILDFGLAKLLAIDAAAAAASATALGTAPLIVMGTPGYMAPEQVRGLAADGRVDLFALGAILYELLGGRRAFEGASSVEALHAVLNDDPRPLPAAAVPPAVDRVVRRCLEKDPDARFQSARDLAFALDTIDADANAPTRAFRAVVGARLATAVVLLAAMAAAAVVWRVLAMRPAPAVGAVTRFDLGGPPGIVAGQQLAIAPDGSLIALAGIVDGVAKVFVRRLDHVEWVPLAGTEGGGAPFFSPDGAFVGFWRDEKVFKIAVTGGARPIELADVHDPLSASWTVPDTIVVASIEHGLQRVPAEGGAPLPLTSADRSRLEIDHHAPQLLPGGRVVIYSVHEGAELFRIVAQTIATGERKTLVEDGFDAQYLPTGHLVYARRRNLYAAPFDLQRLELTGDPIELVENVATVPGSGVGGFAVSASGTLIYINEPPHTDRTLVFVDRTGHESTLLDARRHFVHPRVSPDGQRVAVAVLTDEREDIWVRNFQADTFERITLEGLNRAPVWSRDGTALTFASQNGREHRIVSQRTDAASPATTVIVSRNHVFPSTWSADGRTLVYVDSPPTDVRTIEAATPGDGVGARRIDALVHDADWPTLSPDGRWLAFVSYETRRGEIYVQPYPGPGARRQLTFDGAREPVWGRDGREIFFRTGAGGPMDPSRSDLRVLDDALFVLAFDPSRGAAAGNPASLFHGRYAAGLAGVAGYDVMPDGARFVMVKPSADELARPRIAVTLNWTEELAQRARPRR